MSASSPILLVTGASRGIGAAIARLAANRGFDVAVNYLKDGLQRAPEAEELREPLVKLLDQLGRTEEAARYRASAT